MTSKDARWILRSQRCLCQKKNGLTYEKKLVVVVDCFSFHDRMYGGAGHAP